MFSMNTPQNLDGFRALQLVRMQSLITWEEHNEETNHCEERAKEDADVKTRVSTGVRQ
jgi:hypothetical protein